MCEGVHEVVVWCVPFLHRSVRKDTCVVYVCVGAHVTHVCVQRTHVGLGVRHEALVCRERLLLLSAFGAWVGSSQRIRRGRVETRPRESASGVR